MSKSIPQFFPTDDDPDGRWLAYVALTYRTTRTILRARRVLSEGQTLAHANASRRFLLRSDHPITPDHPILGDLVGSPDVNLKCPVAPFHDLEHLVKDTAAVQTYTAMGLGESPESDLLFWLQPEHILDCFPTMQVFLDFERKLTEHAGKALPAGTRPRAQKTLQAVFGPLHFIEEVDIGRLPYAHLQSYMSSTQSEDRALMIARLERAARRAAASMDTRTEVATLRTIAQIQGLTSQDTDNEKRKFLEIMSGPASTEYEQPRIPDLGRLRSPRLLVEDGEEDREAQ